MISSIYYSRRFRLLVGSFGILLAAVAFLATFVGVFFAIAWTLVMVYQIDPDVGIPVTLCMIVAAIAWFLAYNGLDEFTINSHGTWWRP